MKAYFGSKISQNMTRTPDGFLVAMNVPIARTGWYEYLGNEIGQQGNDVVNVYRDPDEVFSPAAMASFEGKPVCNNHPNEGVDPTNASTYIKGSVSNVRQGKDDDDDLLLADLIIYDADLINAIENGKREVSAGYECDYVPNDDGTYSQKGIVGNHVAVVDAGRAGDRVRINDSAMKRSTIGHKEIASMIDSKAHNHLDDEHLQYALATGGDRYALTKIDPKYLAIEDHESLRDVKPNFDQSKAKPIIVGKDGFVIDGRHRVMSAVKSGVKQIDAYVPEKELWRYRLRAGIKASKDDGLDPQTEQASKHYGISVKKNGHRSPPEGYPADREQYGDPVNFKYPLNGGRKLAAVGYYNYGKDRTDGNYTKEEWDTIGHRIAKANGEGYELKDGRIITPDERDKMKVRDSRMSIKLPNKKQTNVTRLLAAVGLKHFALDAEPEEIMDAVQGMAEEAKDADVGNDFPVPTTQESKNKAGATDENPEESKLDQILKVLNGLCERVDKLEKSEHEEEDPEKELDEAIKQMEDPKDDNGEHDDESHTIESHDEDSPVADPEERTQSGFKAADSAAAVAFLKKMKPAIAAIKDPTEKKRVADAALAAVKGRTPRQSGVYAKMNKPKKTHDSKKNVDVSELGKQWMKKYNPHYKDRV